MSNQGWASDHILRGFAECVIALGHVAENGEVEPHEHPTVLEIASVLPKLAPYIQEVFLLAKIAAWQQKHMTLAVDYRLMDEWNELQALKQQTPLPCPVLLLEAQAA